ncbi:MAG: 3-deoxy-7-phosphoheptulonate synthase [Acidobacteria bacterium]|nr:3-deoxy-7-phosphoheptulonate synthase [Acidobacteriota bacterium]
MTEMLLRTDDLRIRQLRAVIPPAVLMEALPISEPVADLVTRARAGIARVVTGRDSRLLVVVGPCSIHDPAAGVEYARRLAARAAALRDDLLIVMRVYFEKPRTTVGWKGLINDPHLDATFAINDGLRIAREFLLDVNALGLPAAAEFLDPITPQFLADLVSWGAIGARTTESQVHRELASGLSMPVGFKNGTDGTVQVAIDAVRSAAHPHQFVGVTKEGVAAILATGGNPDCHVILRGGTRGPNYSADHVTTIAGELARAALPPYLMVDCSHANSGKDHRRQPAVLRDVAGQIRGGTQAVAGVMLESFLVGGCQSVRPGAPLVFGQSITDACLDWDTTSALLDELADAVRARRSGAADRLEAAANAR